MDPQDTGILNIATHDMEPQILGNLHIKGYQRNPGPILYSAPVSSVMLGHPWIETEV